MMINALIDPQNILIRVFVFFLCLTEWFIYITTRHTACQLLEKAAAQKPL